MQESPISLIMSVTMPIHTLPSINRLRELLALAGFTLVEASEDVDEEEWQSNSSLARVVIAEHSIFHENGQYHREFIRAHGGLELAIKEIKSLL